MWPVTTALPASATVTVVLYWIAATTNNKPSDAYDDNCDDAVIFILRSTPTSRDSAPSPPCQSTHPSTAAFTGINSHPSITGLRYGNPNPPKTIYNHVSIGDVGYVREGVFIRMFNVILPWDHESNRTLGEPEPYESLDCGPFTKILEVPLKTQEYYSRYVSAETNDSNAQAKEPDK